MNADLVAAITAVSAAITSLVVVLRTHSKAHEIATEQRVIHEHVKARLAEALAKIDTLQGRLEDMIARHGK